MLGSPTTLYNVPVLSARVELNRGGLSGSTEAGGDVNHYEERANSRRGCGRGLLPSFPLRTGLFDQFIFTHQDPRFCIAAPHQKHTSPHNMWTV